MKFWRETSGALILIVLFVLAAYFSGTYDAELEVLVAGYGAFGMIAYVGLTIVAVVLAPFSTFPLIPVAVSLWGSFATAILNIIAWTLGSVIAYYLARRFGQPIVRRAVSSQRAAEIARIIKGRHPFWSVLILRMCVPVDILSYALGLFVPLRFSTYTLATLFGVAPFSFVFSYAAELPVIFQLVVLICAAGFAATVFWRLRARI